MDPTPDELAGTVDLFGGLTRSETAGALSDLAARSGTTLDTDALDDAIEDAIENYYLLELDGTAIETTGGPAPAGPILIAGPAALPALPPGGEDLPHLVDIDHRQIDRSTAARRVEGRLRRDAAATIDEDDAKEARRLLDACYEVEAWGPVELDDAKAGLAALLE